MKSGEKIEVLIYKHPLKSDRESIVVEKNTFRKIYEELNLEWDIANYIILDGDKIVTDYTTIPKNDYITIKCVPEGDGGAAREEGVGLKIRGAAIAVIGTIFALPGIVLAGLITLGWGIVLYNKKIEEFSFSTDSVPTKNSPSISGSKNSQNIGGRIPVLFGRHLIYPFIASPAYTSSPAYSSTFLPDLSGQQYLHLLLCSGYKSMEIDQTTIRYGEIPYNAYDFGIVNPPYDIKESSVQNVFYPTRVVQDNANVKIDSFSDFELETPISYERTTATNTKTVTVTIVFPNGLYTKNNTTNVWAQSGFIFEWKDVNGPDSSYQRFGANYFSPVYLTVPEAWTYVAGVMDYTCRLTVSYSFDNITPGNPDYNPDRQYTIRVTRIPFKVINSPIWNEQANNVSATAYLESIKSETASFDSGVDQSPIDAATKANLNVTSFQILATDQLSGVIDNVNYEATAYSRYYLGTGSGPTRWVNGLTSNPASAFLKVLTDSLINKDFIPSSEEADKIDWESLEEWYLFCQDKGFECNAYEVGDVTVSSILTNICSTARASWNILDNKYTIIIDTYNNDIIQYFTPRNTYNFTASKLFNDIPTCFKMKFVDKDNGYIEGTRYVYNDNYNGDPRPTDIIEEMDLYGAMGASQVWKLGRYSHAVIRLRPEIVTFSVDIEYIMCTRGDRIKLNHDVPLFGIISGRALTIIETATETTGIVLDEIIQYEQGKNYAITIRLQDGTSRNINVVNPEVDTSTVLFETPLSEISLLNEDDLVLFGERGSVDVDLIVEKIEPESEISATITCIEYNEAIYEADSGEIPSYDAKVSRGGRDAINVNTLPKSQVDAVGESQEIITVSDQVTYSMSAAYPDSLQSTTAQGWHPSSFDEFNYIYVNYDDGNKIYKKTLTGSENGTAINSVSSRHPYVLGDFIYYVNLEDGGKLYQKGKNDTNDGIAFNTNAVDIFCVDLDVGDIYYINVDDNNYIYKIADGTSGNGVLYKNVSAASIGILGNIFYYKDLSDSYIYTFDVSDVNTITAYYTIDPIQEFYVSRSGYLYYLKSDDYIVYRKSLGSIGLPLNEGEPLIGRTTGFGVTDNGDVIFSVPEFFGVLFLGLSTTSIQNATLEAEATVFTLTGSLTTGSDVITNISIEDLAQVVVRDKIVGNGIPADTQIRMKGNNFIIMTSIATLTLGDTSIEVYGSRITLNANRVIIPGTVTAELLEASAINSKAKTASGFSKTDFDLDNGTMILRKDDDTIVFDFDPDRAGSELIFSGDMEINSDDAGRKLQLGSKGLLVEDASTPTRNTIHDLPDASILTDAFYAGHLYFTANYGTALFNDFTFTGKAEITPSLQGNSNVNAVLITVEVRTTSSVGGNLQFHDQDPDLPGNIYRQIRIYAPALDGIRNNTRVYQLTIALGANKKFWIKNTTTSPMLVTINQQGIYV